MLYKLFIRNHFKYFCTKLNFNDNLFLKIKKFIDLEQKKLQIKKFNFKNKIEFNLIHLGNLNFDLIKYKINLSFNIDTEEIKNKKRKIIFLDFYYFSVKKTNIKVEYKINYIKFIKERNIIYLLFSILINKVVKVSITYIFEGKLLNYFIFYEIFVYDFFNFTNRILNEIQIFELYSYDKDSIIFRATIQSINFTLLKTIPDKLGFKYI